MKCSVVLGAMLLAFAPGCYDCDSAPGWSSAATTTTTAAGGDGGSGGESGGEGGAVNPCPFVSECAPGQGAPPLAPKQCDDGDPLTADRCADAHACGGVCAHLPVECDHHDLATVQASTCDDENDCTADSCTADNHCAHAPTADNLPCGVGGICMQGVCTE